MESITYAPGRNGPEQFRNYLAKTCLDVSMYVTKEHHTFAIKSNNGVHKLSVTCIFTVFEIFVSVGGMVECEKKE